MLTFAKRIIWPVLILSLLAACGRQQDQKTQQSQQDQVFKWKMVTTWPPNFPVFQEGVARFAEDINVLSNGRLKLQVFAGGDLVPPLQAFDAVSQGQVQMGHGAAYYWAGKVPAAQFMSAVPFGMTADGMHAWLYGGDGLDLWRELYEPFNLIPFPLGNSGVQMGGWFNKKIESAEDLKGLKMRIPGLGGKVFAKAGGVPVLTAGSEIYLALDRGAIDATEWVGPFHDQRLGLDRAAKYYYYPGWHEPGTSLELIVNRDAWNTLPKDLQRLIEVTAMANNQRIYAQFQAANLNALNELKSKQHIEVLRFPRDVLKKLYGLAREVMMEEAGKSTDFKRVYEAYEAFRAKNAAWDAISEAAYQKALEDVSQPPF
ncbi:MAG: TRAP transporter substrate-binding protein [Gammaproteobacteria bacterium]|nr:TRAP transporter substrate-binding protein [Gammaproteobacteria bacterium]